MKHLLLDLAVLTLLCPVFAACHRDLTPAQPDCPDCWDEDMVCVQSQCDCRQGDIETWLNLYNYAEIGQTADNSRKFCVKPNKLTFIAYVPKFECVDTFAFTFGVEPLEVNDQTPPLAISTVTPEMPHGWRSPKGLIIDPYDPQGVYVQITGVTPTYGTNFLDCMEYHADGTLRGEPGRVNFAGHFIHPDTIGGYLEFESSGPGNGRRLEGVKVVRTTPY